MHYILESTFPLIFLFLELTLQQETLVFVRQLLYSDWPFKTVRAERKNSCRSKNRNICAKVDSQGLYERSKFLIMGSCSGQIQKKVIFDWLLKNGFISVLE